MKQLFFGPFVCLSSYAAEYRPKEWHSENGYTDSRLNQDHFFVTYSNEDFTDAEEIMRYALCRASQVCMEHGFRYFTILSEKEAALKQLHSEASREYLPWEHYEEAVFLKKQPSFQPTPQKIYLIIQCFQDKKSSDDEIDAAHFLAHSL